MRLPVGRHPRSAPLVRLGSCVAFLALAACSGSGGSVPVSGPSQGMGPAGTGGAAAAAGASTGGKTPAALAMSHALPPARSPGSFAVAPMALVMAPAANVPQHAPASARLSAGLTYTQTGGSASQVAYAPDGSLWLLSNGPSGPDKYIYHYANGAYTNVPGEGAQIAVGPDGSLVVVNSTGGVYQYRSGAYTSLGGGAKAVAVDPSGAIYVISNSPARGDAAIFRYAGGSWSQLAGAGSGLASMPDSSLYVTTSSGAIFDTPVSSIAYTQCPGSASQIAPFPGGAGYIALGYPLDATNGSAVYEFGDATAGSCGSGTYQPLGGAGVDLSALGGALTVLSPSTQIYTTNSLAPPGAQPTIVVHSASKVAPISRLILGANMAAWVDITESGLASALSGVGFTATRWPGGSESDVYHWQTNSSCDGGYTDTNSTFDNFMADVAKPANLDVAITLNYGSNAACDAGGDPTEAAAWVSHAKSAGDNISYWTVGNEDYGSWEYDLHAKPNDPGTYASAVASGYYPDIKAADSNAKVGVVVEGDPSWDATVLSSAKYDFVELHSYFTGPGQENDQTLLQQGAPALTSQIQQLKSELANAGKPNTPIYLGELGSVYANPGKQSMSIVQGLFAGMVLGEMMNDGVYRATWWLGFGGCDDSSSGANFSSSLYGWQNFGGYMTLSDGTPEYGCSNATAVPLGTPFPTARAYQLMSAVARDGESALGVTTSSSLPQIRSYAATHGTGYSVVLFNLDENDGYVAQVGVDALGSGSSATMTTYGKKQYDDSQNDVWTGPVTQSTGAWENSVPVTLPPWSMTVVQLSP